MAPAKSAKKKASAPAKKVAAPVFYYSVNNYYSDLNGPYHSIAEVEEAVKQETLDGDISDGDLVEIFQRVRGSRVTTNIELKEI